MTCRNKKARNTTYNDVLRAHKKSPQNLRCGDGC